MGSNEERKKPSKTQSRPYLASDFNGARDDDQRLFQQNSRKRKQGDVSSTFRAGYQGEEYDLQQLQAASQHNFRGPPQQQ